MNTINTNAALFKASSHLQANTAENNFTANKTSQKLDSFTRSSNSLVPETYTKELSSDVTQSKANKSNFPDIDLESLTQEEIDKYFGYSGYGDSVDTYLPIINAPDEVKKAWIAAFNQLTTPEERGDMKGGLAVGCIETYGEVSGELGKKMSSNDFFLAMQTNIEGALTGRGTYKKGPATLGTATDGQKDYAARMQKYYDIFESFYKKYSK